MKTVRFCSPILGLGLLTLGCAAERSSDQAPSPTRENSASPASGVTFDSKAIEDMLADAPRDGVEVSLPMPDGSAAVVNAVPSRLMGPKLTAKYPSIKTYVFHSPRGPYVAGHLVVGPAGVRATARTTRGLVRIEPSKGARDGELRARDLRERSDGGDMAGPAFAALPAGMMLDISALETGSQIRTYELAATTTGEFYQARGGNDEDVMDSLVDDLAGANTVLEPEVAVRLVLADITDDLLYDDPDTDPFNGASECEDSGEPCQAHSDCDPDERCVVEEEICTLRDDNVDNMQGVVDDEEDPDAYDLGFLFGARAGGGANGCAWYVVCLTESDSLHKARGAATMGDWGLNSAGGVLAHEVGHMLGARHTFSGMAGSCTENEFLAGDSESAYEPGSGTTRMSYRGNCADDPEEVDDPQDDNVDTSEDNARYGQSGGYFHSRSFDEIVDNVFNGDGATCGSLSNTGNTAPIPDAGPDYTIPRETPFTLVGSASDNEGDDLFYNWEQYDRAETRRPIDTDDGEGPIIRSVPPTPDPSRTIPHILDLLDGVVRKGEILPEMNRDLNFRFIARDLRMGGGGVAYDAMVVHVNGPPFFITSPNSGSLQADCTEPLTWEVGGGDVAPNVSVLFSNDGGLSFDTTVVASTPNDGATDITVPCDVGTDRRIKVAAIDNIFFDISNDDITVFNNPPNVNASTAGGSVDENCEFLVEFEATATDACAISASDVEVQLFKAQNNFTLGTPNILTMQVSPTEVKVTGSVLVSELLSSPAKLGIVVDAADGCDVEGEDFVEAVIVDDIPPTIDVSVDPDSLWPPNHKMVPIAANVVAMDNCPGVTFELAGATSDEPDNGSGDGDTVDDIQDADIGTPDVSVSLRAERAGPGDGRVYTLTYKAIDGSDNEAEDSATVTVPKHQ